MTTRLLILLAAAALLCWAAPAQAQTIKSLGFNTTNGQVVYTGTNTLTFTNALAFGTNAATTRTNLGLGPIITDGEFLRLEPESAVEVNALNGIAFTENPAGAAATRTNLGMPLNALTNTSNVTTMRALAGSTNTNQPFSGSISLTNTNTLVFSNGILLSQ